MNRRRWPGWYAVAPPTLGLALVWYGIIAQDVWVLALLGVFVAYAVGRQRRDMWHHTGSDPEERDQP